MLKSLAITLVLFLSVTVTGQEIKKLKIKQLEKEWKQNPDKIYIVNFWATWCGPCVKELPDFEKINAEFDTTNVEVLLVSLDFKEDYDTKLPAFLKKKNIKSRVVWLNESNPTYYIPKVSKDWNGAIPGTLILYGKEKHRKFYEHVLTYEQLKENIIKLMK